MRNVLTDALLNNESRVISRRAFPMLGPKASMSTPYLAKYLAVLGLTLLIAFPAYAVKLTDLQIGRASCRERV